MATTWPVQFGGNPFNQASNTPKRLFNELPPPQGLARSPVPNGYHSGEISPRDSICDTPATERTLFAEGQQQIAEPKFVRFRDGGMNAKFPNVRHDGGIGTERPRCDTPAIPSTFCTNSFSKLRAWLERAKQPLVVAVIIVLPPGLEGDISPEKVFDPYWAGYRLDVSRELYREVLELRVFHCVIWRCDNFWR